ncbi:unnamed protein product [Eretmochelys imbricata]
MQSSSAEVTMMESQNRKRAPTWTEREVRDLIAVWGEESVLSELRSSFRNAKTFVKISQGMKDRGHNRDPKQCRMKLKELRQAYQKTREANGRSWSEPQTCRFYDELCAILGGSATTTPAVLFDSFNGDGGNTEAGFGDEEDDDDEVVDSSQLASGETGFPDSQELFLTLDLEPVPPNPPKAASWTQQVEKGPPELQGKNTSPFEDSEGRERKAAGIESDWREEKLGVSAKQTETERQKIVSEFQQLRQLLEEQERLLLAQLEKLDKEIVKIQNENITKLSEGISRLSELISEMEGKCQKPASDFLQDVRSTLRRCEKGKFQQPEEISPELEERVSDFSQKTIVLMETLRKFKDTLPSALESLGAHRQVNVILDPDTAHPILVLSEGGKSVRWGDTRQRLPDTPERFDTELCVLGCGGFTAGRHCWEVEVAGEGYWALGVVRKSVGRKGGISCSPEGGIWAVERWWDQFRALTSPVTPLPRSRAPSRIRVCLDCGRGQVTFIDAGDEAPIFTFPPGSVPGERIRPWIRVWPGSRLRLRPCDPQQRGEPEISPSSLTDPGLYDLG